MRSVLWMRVVAHRERAFRSHANLDARGLLYMAKLVGERIDELTAELEKRGDWH